MTAAWMENLELLAEAPDGIKKLRELILELAVRGKLVPQDPSDEPASELLKRIAAEKARLVAEGKIKKQKPLAEIGEEEKPFELPVGWEWTRFGSVCAIRGELVRPEDFPDLRQVAPDCIEKGTGHLTESRTVKESGVKGPNSRFFAGQLLYSKIRPSLSKAVLVDFDGLCSADMYPLDSFIDPVFLLKEILSEIFLEQVRVAENRIKMPKLNQDSLSSFVLPIPPLAEQHRIVAKVDELMALCDRLEARQADAQHAHARLVQALLDSLTQARDAEEFQAAWERVAGEFQISFATVETVDKLKQVIRDVAVSGRLLAGSAGDGSWEWSTLGAEVAGMDSGWSPACLDTPAPSEEAWGVLRTTAVQTLQYVQAENKALPSHLEPRPEAEVRAGDILFTRAGPMNRVAISCLVEATRPRLMLSDKIIRFQPKAHVIGNFMALCLNAGKTAEYLEQAKSGMAASQVNISQAKLKAAPIPVPPIDEQRRIVAKVTELLALCDQLKAKIAAARAKQAQLAEALVKQAVATAAG